MTKLRKLWTEEPELIGAIGGIIIAVAFMVAAYGLLTWIGVLP